MVWEEEAQFMEPLYKGWASEEGIGMCVFWPLHHDPRQYRLKWISDLLPSRSLQMRAARLCIGAGLLLPLLCTFYVVLLLHQEDIMCGRCAHCATQCCSPNGVCGLDAAHCAQPGSLDCRSSSDKYPDPVIALPKLMDHLVRNGDQTGLSRGRANSNCGWAHLALPQRVFPSLCPVGQWCDTRHGTCTWQPEKGCDVWCVQATKGAEVLEAALMSHLEERKRAGAWLGLQASPVKGSAAEWMGLQSSWVARREGKRCTFSEKGFELCKNGEICDMWTEECVQQDAYRCAPMEWACYMATGAPQNMEIALMLLIRARIERLDHRERLSKRTDNGQCKSSETAGPAIPIPKILWWNNCDMHDDGQKAPSFPNPVEVAEDCPTPCLMTDNLKHLDDVDGVIIRVDYCMGNSGLNPEEVRLGGDLPPRRKLGQTWIAYSSENPYNYPRMADRNYMQHFNYSAFQSLSSDFPVAYAANIGLGDDGTSQIGLIGSSLVRPWTELAQPVPFEKKTGFAAYIYSNCDTPSKRDSYTRELMKHVQVDAFGRCLRNKEWPSGMRDAGMADPNREAIKDAVMGSYKFELTFQNARCDDEIDEKMLQAMRRGVVPVYMGAPNINHLRFPEKSFIHAGDFESPEQLGAYLVSVAEDKKKYESYLGWRLNFQGILPPFTQRFLKRPKLECWLCQQLHEHKEKVACAKPDLSCRKMQDHAFHK